MTLILIAIWPEALGLVQPWFAPNDPSNPLFRLADLLGTLALAFGVWRGKRLARWLARALGYTLGIGAWVLLSFMPLGHSPRDWWLRLLAGGTGAVAVLLLTQLGWAGDEQ